jgi:hypothetical protein
MFWGVHSVWREMIWRPDPVLVKMLRFSGTFRPALIEGHVSLLDWRDLRAWSGITCLLPGTPMCHQPINTVYNSVE